MHSALYVTREHKIFIGREAIDTCYRQNVGRPSRMVRQRVGEIEMTIATSARFGGGDDELAMEIFSGVAAGPTIWAWASER